MVTVDVSSCTEEDVILLPAQFLMIIVGVTERG